MVLRMTLVKFPRSRRTDAPHPMTQPPGFSAPGSGVTHQAASHWHPAEWVVLALLGLFLVGVGCLTLHPYLLMHNSDGAVLFLLGKSLILGHGYVLGSYPEPQPYFAFTPFFPLQMAALMGLAQTTRPEVIIPLAKWYELGLLGGTLLLYYAGLRSPVGRGLALVLTAILAVDGTLHHYLSDVLADVPYLFMSMLTLGAWMRWNREPDTGNAPSKRGEDKWMALTVIILSLLILTRPIGLAFAMAACLLGLLKRRWKQVLVMGFTALAVFGGWSSMEHLYRSTHRTEGEAMNRILEKSPVKLEFIKYFSVVKPEEEDEGEVRQVKGPGEFLKNALHRSEQYARMMSESFFPSGKAVPKPFKLIFLLATLGLMAAGIRQVLTKAPQGQIIPLYCACYLLVLFSYPYVSVRYLIPIQPFVLLFFFWGLVSLLKSIKPLPPRLSPIPFAPLAFAMMALMTFAVQWQESLALWNQSNQLLVQAKGPAVSDTRQGYYASCLWMQGHLPPNSLVFSRKPEILHLYGGVKSERFPFYSDPARLFQWFSQKQVQYGKNGAVGVYFLEDRTFKESKALLPPVVQRFGQNLSLVYEEPKSHTRLWEIR